MKKSLRSAVLGFGLLAATAAMATASNKELEARANDTDARLEALESRLGQSLTDLQQQIQAAQEDLRKLRGQIEQAQHDLETVQQQQRDLYSDLDRRVLVIENGAGGSVPVSSGGATQAPDVVFADEAAVYGDAFAAMKASRYSDAERGFQTYLAKYPRGPKADSATYWLGEAQYMQQEIEPALKSYQAVEKFPESRRLADAMFKVGVCQYDLKAFRNARATWEKVVSTYPESDAAAQARTRIEQLNAEKR
jgi:tol-pal system protein YbgF